MTSAGAVGPQNGNPVTEPDLGVERLHEAGQLKVVDHDRAFAGGAPR